MTRLQHQHKEDDRRARRLAPLPRAVAPIPRPTAVPRPATRGRLKAIAARVVVPPPPTRDDSGLIDLRALMESSRATARPAPDGPTEDELTPVPVVQYLDVDPLAMPEARESAPPEAPPPAPSAQPAPPPRASRLNLALAAALGALVATGVAAFLLLRSPQDVTVHRDGAAALLAEGPAAGTEIDLRSAPAPAEPAEATTETAAAPSAAESAGPAATAPRAAAVVPKARSGKPAPAAKASAASPEPAASPAPVANTPAPDPCNGDLLCEMGRSVHGS